MGVKISELAEANTLGDSNLLAIVQNGETKKINVSDFFSKYPATPYTQASGTHTTAAWGDGTNTVTWTSPRTGLYLFFSRFSIDDDSNAQIYKQFQLKGTSTRITGDVLFYQPGPLTATANALGIGIFSACSLIYAEQGQTVVPRVWTGTAGIVWNVNFTSLFIK